MVAVKSCLVQRTNMKLFLVVLSVTAALAAPPRYEEIVLDYHGQIGIPMAERIKSAETAMDFDGSRIVGGSPATSGQFPYLGGVIINLIAGGQSVCGSTLLSANRAVTAAHCWTTRQHQGILLTVVFGSLRLFSGGVRVISNNVHVHKDYNMNNRNNDVAMIYLPTVAATTQIKPIAIATSNNLFVNTNAVAAGFGRTSDDDDGQITTGTTLRHVQLRVISNRQCSNTFGSLIVSSTLCVSGAGGRSTCTGDGGGPLVANNELIGITSFEAQSGCQRNLPAGFQRVTAFNAWIRARI